jgi:hypothetical protein
MFSGQAEGPGGGAGFSFDAAALGSAVKSGIGDVSAGAATEGVAAVGVEGDSLDGFAAEHDATSATARVATSDTRTES